MSKKLFIPVVMVLADVKVPFELYKFVTVEGVVQDNIPVPFVVSTWFAFPSVVGKVKV